MSEAKKARDLKMAQTMTLAALVKRIAKALEEDDDDAMTFLEHFVEKYPPGAAETTSAILKAASIIQKASLLDLVLEKFLPATFSKTFLSTLKILSVLENFEQDMYVSEGIAKVVYAMQENAGDEVTQVLGCQILAYLALDEAVRDAMGEESASIIDTIMAAITKWNLESPKLVVCGLVALSNFCYDRETNKSHVGSVALESLIPLSRKHIDTPHTLTSFLLLFRNLSNHDDNKANMGVYLISIIASVLDKYSYAKHPSIVSHCIHILTNLCCGSDKNKETAFQAGIISIVQRILPEIVSHSNLVINLCALLLHMARLHRCRDKMAQESLILHLFTIVEMFKESNADDLEIPFKLIERLCMHPANRQLITHKCSKGLVDLLQIMHKQNNALPLHQAIVKILSRIMNSTGDSAATTCKALLKENQGISTLVTSMNHHHGSKTLKDRICSILNALFASDSLLGDSSSGSSPRSPRGVTLDLGDIPDSTDSSSSSSSGSGGSSSPRSPKSPKSPRSRSDSGNSDLTNDLISAVEAEMADLEALPTSAKPQSPSGDENPKEDIASVLKPLEAEENAQLDKQQQEKERQEQERIKAEEAAAAEVARVEAQRLENERQEQERVKAEEAAAEAARIETERLEKERLEQERIKAEEAAAAEVARIEAERLEKERQEQERVKAEAAAAEAARVEHERLEKERQDQERIKAEAEAARIEAERLEQERIKAEEAARIEIERLEKERLEQERIKAEEAAAAEAARVEAERLEKERQEQERVKAEEAAAEAARVETERLEKERLEQERIKAEEAAAAEVARIEAERLEKERQEQERVKAEAAAAEATRVEQERLSAEQKAKERLAEEVRIAEEKRKADEARIAEEKQKAEEARIAEQKRKADEARIAEEKQKAAEDAKAAEEKRKSEAKLAAEKLKAAEEAKAAEAKRKAEEKMAAEKQKADEVKEAETISNQEESNNTAGTAPKKVPHIPVKERLRLFQGDISVQAEPSVDRKAKDTNHVVSSSGRLRLASLGRSATTASHTTSVSSSSATFEKPASNSARTTTSTSKTTTSSSTKPPTVKSTVSTATAGTSSEKPKVAAGVAKFNSAASTTKATAATTVSPISTSNTKTSTLSTTKPTETSKSITTTTPKKSTVSTTTAKPPISKLSITVSDTSVKDPVSNDKKKDAPVSPRRNLVHTSTPSPTTFGINARASISNSAKANTTASTSGTPTTPTKLSNDSNASTASPKTDPFSFWKSKNTPAEEATPVKKPTSTQTKVATKSK